MSSTGETNKPSPNNDRSESEGGKHWLEYAIFFFVILTAAGTITAACYTRKQWITMDDTEKRQLRAYICLNSATRVQDPHKTGAFAAQINIKNCGQTPAYDLAVWSDVVLKEYPLKTQLSTDIPSVLGKSVLGPGGERFALPQVPVDRRLTSEDDAALEAGTKAIFAFGEIRFKDAFDGDRWATFRWVFSGDSYRIGTAKAAEEGNDQN